ncbi:MAG: TonB C-terminal domain-containing protein [Elusimicrobia bacterium]|nr:TonB C-terminal domain-containing protein [Elusimicrobiota bacterium]
MKEAVAVSGFFHAAALTVFFVLSVGKIKPPKAQYVVDLSIGGASLGAPAAAGASPSDFIPFQEEIEDPMLVPSKEKKPEPKSSPAELGSSLKSRSQPALRQGSTMGGQALVGVGSGISNFPFPFYIEAIRKRIAANWDAQFWREQLLERRAQATFTINRDGSVSPPELEEKSGDSYFDSTCLRSIAVAAPFQPLPQGFKADRLRIVFDFEISP